MLKRALSAACGAAFVAAGFAIPDASAQELTDSVSVNLEEVASGLTSPVMLTSAPDDSGRLFVVEQHGTIRVIDENGELLGQPFLNIRHKIIDLNHDFDERGLLSIAFHPDFAENGRFYVYYSGHIPGDAGMDAYLWYSHTNFVAEYTVRPDNPNIADSSTERVLMAMDWPQFNHNGGWIDFGEDGYLYISTGDGGYADDYGIGHNKEIGNAQDLTSLNGKILRIDVDAGEEGDPYAIPEDNPFADDPQALPEIYAYGLRNPWRCSFDQEDGRLFCADVGQNSYEEVSIIEAGGNYGWRVKEGTHCFDWVNPNQHPEQCDDEGLIDPVIEYNNCNVTRDCLGISVTGGYVHRGAGDLNGTYIFGDWSNTFAPANGRIYAARENGEGEMWDIVDVEVENMDFGSYVLAFGQDADGEVYVLTTNVTGPVGALDSVYRITTP